MSVTKDCTHQHAGSVTFQLNSGSVWLGLTVGKQFNLLYLIFPVQINMFSDEHPKRTRTKQWFTHLISIKPSPSHSGWTCDHQNHLHSVKPAAVFPKTPRGDLRLAASSGRFASSAVSACGGKETASRWESPPEIPGSTHPDARQKDGNWGGKMEEEQTEIIRSSGHDKRDTRLNKKGER